MTNDDASMAGAFIERTRVAIKSLEDERISLVGPLNVKLEAIYNEPYRLVRKPLEQLYDLVRGRLTSYTRAEEQAMPRKPRRLREAAEAKERAARAAEFHEQEAISNAAVGEATDVGGLIAEADQAFGDFAKANRAAAVAERNQKVRLGSVMGGRPISMRTRRVLVIDDPAAAIKAMGVTEKIAIAIRQSAAAFEDAYGEPPTGISETAERSI